MNYQFVEKPSEIVIPSPDESGRGICIVLNAANQVQIPRFARDDNAQ